ncbi:MAG: homocysteine S-methyltransferase family protein [Monoglobaceae bacterium]
MNILEYLENNIVYLDGGMGTLLQAEGLPPGELPERWNLTHAEVIRKIHKAYFDAGSNVINTNTFGANSLKFSDAELEKVISAAVENAKAARTESAGSQPKFIALDIGPVGRLLKPYGDLEFEDAVECFKKTVQIGVKCGVDLIFIETMNDSYETKAALLAAKESCDLPVFVSNAYGGDGKLMTGASPEAMVAMLEGMGADAIGANCSLGPVQLRGVVERLLECASVPVLLKPNAGLPKSVDGKTVFDVDADEFAEEVTRQIRHGVRIAGGCCGTTPEYIRALAEKSSGVSPKPISDKNRTVVSSYTHTVCFGQRPVLIGERINPTGKKRFKQALKENDMGYILREGLAQQERGVHILDVNVGLPEIDEAEMLKSAVCELQAIINLPLQIDTADAAAMEGALRLYNGKAMVNSVNGKEESMRAVFPLVRKYGGVVVALTLDENGIPSSAEERFRIAERIIATAAEYGIEKKDLVFDTLAMTVSADAGAAMTAVTALNMIRHKLGCHTSLGISNVSFGLPSRDALNSGFYLSALENGLSAAIMNPYSEDMMKAYHAYLALHGMDENCAEYIAFMTSHSSEEKKTEKVASETDVKEELKSAVISGLRARAAELTDRLLEDEKPMDIVNSCIIPALDTVGKGFEEKRIYLPQLLMSAESASEAFEKIKLHMLSKKSDLEAKCKFVIATVHGDIHDIGKNIVKLLLENYGFDVIDLGKDVPPETVVDAVVKNNAPMAGLSVLMTTTVPAMEKTIELLREAAPWCKIVVGGAVLTREYADSIGADKYAADAMETVRYAEEINAALKN